MAEEKKVPDTTINAIDPKKIESQHLNGLPTQADLAELTDLAFFDDINKPEEGLNFATAWVTPFKIRTAKPVKADNNSKCYVNYETGGWSGAIVCSDDYANVLPNCVGYANGRFNEIYDEMKGTTGSKYPWFNCNACNFIKRRNEMYPELQIGNDPKPGAIIVWTGGWGDYGHVAIVERINYDGSILTSESAYGGSAFYNCTRYKANEWGMGGTYKFAGFIYNPAVPDIAPGVTPTVDKDDKNNQLVCSIPDLRVRTSPSLATDENILGLLEQDGYYNYYEVKTADNYEWYRIADSQWCARVGKTEPAVLPGKTNTIYPPKYKVNVTEYKEGTIYVDKPEAFAYDTVYVDVVPDKHYSVKKIMVNGKEVLNNKFDMPRIGNVTLTAEFEESSFDITCEPCVNGEISTDKKVASPGELVTVSARPDEGYRLKRLYSEQVTIVNNSFNMANEDVTIYGEFEPIVAPVFEIGTVVKIKKVGNSKPNGTGHTVFYVGGEYTITNIMWTSNLTLEDYPYQLSAWDGTIIGYYQADAIEYYKKKDPVGEFNIGDEVKITGKGNSKPDGSGLTTFGIG